MAQIAVNNLTFTYEGGTDAVLIAAEDEFLLIDELTNHLDAETRGTVKRHLASKSGFILVSHDSQSAYAGASVYLG